MKLKFDAVLKSNSLPPERKILKFIVRVLNEFLHRGVFLVECPQTFLDVFKIGLDARLIIPKSASDI